MLSLGQQLGWLALLATVVASISWTVTHEEVFREPRDWCQRISESSRSLPVRKLAYLFTCEYCFSHYVAALVVWLSRFTLLVPTWEGYVLAGFALVWVSNVYMSLYSRLRLDIRNEKRK